MVRKSEKKIKKLSRSRWWITLPLIVLFIWVVFELMNAAMKETLDTLMEKSLQTDYQAVSRLADLYLYGEENGDEKIAGYLNTVDADWFVTDGEGNIIDGNRENTCSDVKATITQTDLVTPVVIHEDTENDVLYVKNGKSLHIHYKKFWKRLEKVVYEEDKDHVDVDISHVSDAENGDSDLQEKIEFNLTLKDNMYLPLWAEVPFPDGRIFVGKVYFRINTSDLMLLAIFTIVIFVLLIFLVIFLLIRSFHLRRKQKKMATLYYTDDITGGRNWKYFHSVGEDFLQKRKTADRAYAILDIDFVKYRNYCICHSVEDGEKLLQKLYTKLGQNLNKQEMFAHYGSANFAVLLEMTTEEELVKRVRNLMVKLENAAPGRQVRFHIGIDMIPANVDENGKKKRRKNIDLEKAYNNACAARATLSETDESGIQIFDEHLVKAQKWEMLVQERQYRAVEGEEFMVYYQPKYDPRTNRLSGAEALIRWQSSSLGFLPPGKFIPIFEKNGFITEIDHYMLRHVAEDQKKWLDRGFSLVPVSVNVSRAHFAESDLAEQIRDIVDEVGTPHEYIEIELTESAFFDDKKALVTIIKRLQEYGFAVSMDDFGSGYSSLNSLKDMPLDVLKLDADFFRGEFDDTRGEIVVAEAIKLAKSLHMRTVAEGVEVREQVDFLAKQGCDMIQGYYYAKPMPANEYEIRMQTGIKDPEAEKRAEEADKVMAAVTAAIAQDAAAAHALAAAEESLAAEEKRETEENPEAGDGDASGADGEEDAEAVPESEEAEFEDYEEDTAGADSEEESDGESAVLRNLLKRK